MPIKGESKTTKTRTCRLFSKNSSYREEDLDWCWTRRVFILQFCGVEEINSCSSTCKNAKRRRWSGWILENKKLSSETFPALSSLVWRQVEETHGRWRSKQEKTPVLYWFMRNKSLPPSSSRSCRTMLLFRATSPSTFIMSTVQSIHIPSSIRDWHLKVNIWTTDRQYSFCLWIPWTKTIRILIRSTWVHRVMHHTYIKHGRDIRTQCIGSTSIFLWGKDWSSIRLDRTQSSFKTHFQPIVFRKLLGWKLENSYSRKYMRHLGLLQRSPWNMTGIKNWAQKMLNDQVDKLFNNPEVPNQTN